MAASKLVSVVLVVFVVGCHYPRTASVPDSSGTASLPDSRTALADTRARHVRKSWLLEMRPVVHETYAAAGVRFDLKEEEKRLRSWLENRQMRTLVANDPVKIEVFNKRSPEEGGPLSPHVRWYPHVIHPSRSDPGRWGTSYRDAPNVLVVRLYEEKRYLDGVDGAVERLVELVAVNTHAPYFTSADVDPDTLLLRHEQQLNGQLVLEYSLNEDRLGGYSAWTKSLVGQSIAEMIDGQVVWVPWFQSEMSGRRQVLPLPFTEKEGHRLIRRLKIENARER